MPSPELLSALASLLIAAGSLYVAITTRRRNDAEARKLDQEAQAENGNARRAISDAAVSLVKPLEERVNRLADELEIARATIRELQCQVDMLKTENTRLQSGIELLMHQVITLGQQPIFTPGTKT